MGIFDPVFYFFARAGKLFQGDNKIVGSFGDGFLLESFGLSVAFLALIVIDFLAIEMAF